MNRLFIVNPLSERVKRKGSSLEPLANKLGYICVRLDSFDQLSAAVNRAAKKGVDHVIIEGGDGTVQGVISAFLSQAEKFEPFPSFSIVPGGMTNQVAKNIGLKSAKPKNVESALNVALQKIRLPLLNVTDSDGSTHSGFLLSTGAIPQITRYTKNELHKKGIGGSAAVIGGILEGIWGNDTHLMRCTPIELAGLFAGSHLGSVVTTLPSLMLGLDPFWGTEDAPIRLTWADAKYRRLGRNIMGLWAGRKSKDRSADGLFSKHVDDLSYVYAGDIVLDGEFLSIPSGKFTIRPTRTVTFLK